MEPNPETFIPVVSSKNSISLCEDVVSRCAALLVRLNNRKCIASGSYEHKSQTFEYGTQL